MLYTLLPNGIAGPYLTNCPGLDTDIALLHALDRDKGMSLAETPEESSWLGAYTVSKMAVRLRQIKNRVAGEQATRAVHFQRLFPHARYVKTTVKNHIGLLTKADQWGWTVLNPAMPWLDMASHVRGTARRNRMALILPSTTSRSSLSHDMAIRPTLQDPVFGLDIFSGSQFIPGLFDVTG